MGDPGCAGVEDCRVGDPYPLAGVQHLIALFPVPVLYWRRTFRSTAVRVHGGLSATVSEAHRQTDRRTVPWHSVMSVQTFRAQSSTWHSLDTIVALSRFALCVCVFVSSYWPKLTQNTQQPVFLTAANLSPPPRIGAGQSVTVGDFWSCLVAVDHQSASPATGGYF